MRRQIIICLSLAAAVLVIYGQTIGFGYVDIDDYEFVQENLYVRAGLTATGVRWAWSNSVAGNWHPVTNLSHMVDGQLFALHAGGHHVTNVALHVINTLLLFALLQLTTGRVWAGAFTAALFALHPLHVESVAWISERKDVLSTLFAFLSIWAYVKYARGGHVGLYLLCVVFLAVGLMTKPMLVTMPCVFLLLDYWPLYRMAGRRAPAADARWVCRGRSAGFLLLEKVPFFVLAAASSVMTYLIQRRGGSVAPGDAVQIKLRLANAVMAYVRYLGKTIWPSDLMVLYLHPNVPGGTPWTIWQVTGATVLLTAVTVLTIMALRRHLIVGWLWFLGTLVPVIGVIQAGNQAMADRYTYLPLIGVFIMIAFTGAQIITRWGHRRHMIRFVMATVAVLIVAASIICALVQTRYWRNSMTLFRHAVEVEPRNPIMLVRLGRALQMRGAERQASDYFRRALNVNGGLSDAHIYLAIDYLKQEEYDRAIWHLERARRISPTSAEAHQILGFALQQTGRHEPAIALFKQAIKLNGDMYQAYNSLGDSYRALGRSDEAVGQYLHALTINPDFAPAHLSLAMVYQSQGRNADAIDHLTQVVQLHPRYAEGHIMLGLLLRKQGQLEQAIRHFELAVASDPNNAAARRHLDAALRSRRAP